MPNRKTTTKRNTGWPSKFSANPSRLFGLIFVALIFNPTWGFAQENAQIGEAPEIKTLTPDVADSLNYLRTTEEPVYYEFRVEYEVGGVEKVVTGFLNVTIDRQNLRQDLSGTPLGGPQTQSTSSVFVISEDGYLLTCYHCVESPERIEVELAGKTYPAKLVDFDRARDIAILKVDAAGLTPVSLGDSDEAKLAQPVRMFGFPLSEVLGKSLKMASGNIAGFVHQGTSKFNFQLDAAVNPGHSGGPLVDEFGQVIGIVNAKLSGKSVSKIGFSIPINMAKRLLSKNQIEFLSSKQKTKLDASTIVNQIESSIGFAHAVHRAGQGSGPNRLFRIKGSITENQNGEKQRTTLDDLLLLSETGVLLDSRTTAKLPFTLGAVAELPFEMLPEFPTPKWKTSETVLVPLPKNETKSQATHPSQRTGIDPFQSRIEETLRRQHFPTPFGALRGFRDTNPLLPPSSVFPNVYDPFGYDPFGRSHANGAGNKFNSPKLDFRSAIAKREISYQLSEVGPKSIKLTSKTKLNTTDGNHHYSALSMTLDSTHELDRVGGYFRNKNSKGNIRLKLGKQSMTIPINVRLKQIELEKLVKPEPREKTKPLVPLTDSELADFLAINVNNVDSNKLLGQLQSLAITVPVSSSRESVDRQLRRLESHPRGRIRDAALCAQLHWNGQNLTQTIVQALQESGPFEKKTWLIKLGKTGDPAAALELIEWLHNPDFNVVAKSSLINLGVIAEPRLLELVSAESVMDETKEKALEILGHTGTQTTIQAVQALVNERPDWSLKARAELTIQKVLDRKPHND